MSKVYEIFGCPKRDGLAFGCEFELESINATGVGFDALFSAVTDDNSLRNNGKEFITKPLPLEKIVQAHAYIFNGTSVAFENMDDVCTDRCSTHIHVNFSDVDEEKVRQFIRLYCLIEPLFFNVVGESRKNNIYCVPIASTNLLRQVLTKHLDYLAETWHKYAAFNVKPLSNLGTIEFRHFEATMDTAKLSRWLHMIANLYNFNMNYEVDVLITDSMLYRLVNAVSDIPYSRDDIYKMCEDTLTNDLLLMVNPTKELLMQRLKQSKVTA